MRGKRALSTNTMPLHWNLFRTLIVGQADFAPKTADGLVECDSIPTTVT